MACCLVISTLRHPPEEPTRGCGPEVARDQANGDRQGEPSSKDDPYFGGAGHLGSSLALADFCKGITDDLQHCLVALFLRPFVDGRPYLVVGVGETEEDAFEGGGGGLKGAGHLGSLLLSQ